MVKNNRRVSQLNPKQKEIIFYIGVLFSIFAVILWRSHWYGYRFISIGHHPEFYASMLYIIALNASFWLLTKRTPLLYLNEQFNNGNWRKALIIIAFWAFVFAEITGSTDILRTFFAFLNVNVDIKIYD